MQHEFKLYTDEQIHELTFSIAKKEQSLTLQFLEHLHEVDARRIYAQKSYSSLWEYVHKCLGYGEGPASERCNAMRLLYSVDSAKEKVANGQLSLTVAAKVQRFFYAQKRHEQKTYTPEEKKVLIEKVSGKSSREAEKLLALEAPELLSKEKERVLNSENLEIKFIADSELQLLLNRVKELDGNMKYSEIIKRTLKEYLKRRDPIEKAKQASANTDHKKQESKPNQIKPLPHFWAHKNKKNSRYISLNKKLVIWQRANSQCEYKDQTTQKRCECRTRLEIDHVVPYAKKGSNEINNLRLLCPAHNQYSAILAYGKAKMQNHLPGLR